MRIICVILLLSIFSFKEACSSIDIDVDPGIGGFYRTQRWFPLEIIVQNDGQSINGILSTNLSGIKYELPIDLPTKSRKKVFLYLYPTTIEREIKLSLHSNKSFVSDNVSKIESLDQSTILVGILKDSELAKTYPFLEDKNYTFRVIDLLPEKLPDKWVGHDTLDIIIFDNLDPSLLSFDQKIALKNWLFSGGRLFIYGNYPNPLQDEYYKDLLPVNEIRVTTTKERYTASSELALDSNTLKKKSKTVRYLNGIPVITKLDYGLGKIVYSTIPFSSPMLKELTKDDLIHNELFHFNRKPYRNKKLVVGQDLSENISIDDDKLLLSWEYILYFLIIYVVCLIALYCFVFRKNKSYIFNLITLIFFPMLLTSIFGAMLFMSSSHNVKIDNYSLLIGSEQTRERILSNTFCILSAQKRKRLEIGIRNASFVIESANPEEVSLNDKYILTESKYASLKNMNLNPLANNSLFLRGFLESDEFIDANISWHGNSITGSITNTSQCKFQHCVVLTADSYYNLSDLDAMETIELDSEQHHGILDQKSLTKNEKRFYNLIKEVLFESVVRDQYPVLLGWTNQPVLSYSLNEKYFINTQTSLLIYYL